MLKMALMKIFICIADLETECRKGHFVNLTVKCLLSAAPVS